MFMRVRVQEHTALENNMKVEVSGKLKTHFNTAPKNNNTSAGVSIIMVSNVAVVTPSPWLPHRYDKTLSSTSFLHLHVHKPTALGPSTK